MAVSGLDEDEYLEEEMDVPKSENEVSEEDKKSPQTLVVPLTPQNADSRIRRMNLKK